MNLIYVHIGDLNVTYNNITYSPFNKSYTSSKTPEHLWYSVKQSRKYFKDKIYIVLPEQDIEVNKLRAKLYDCELIPFESFLTGDNTSNINSKASYVKKFIKLCVTQGHTNNHFLCVTFLRLFVVCELIRNYQLQKVWHLENDNLLFQTLPEMGDSTVFTVDVSDEETSAGILYIPNSRLATDFADTLLSEYTKTPDKSEMNILAKVSSGKDPRFGCFSNQFDGASYGQYLFGTNQGHPPGTVVPHHYFANSRILDNTDVKYIRENPYLTSKKFEAVPIYNLHIHNKQCIEDIVYSRRIFNVTVGLMTAPQLSSRYLSCWYTWLQDFEHKFVFTGQPIDIPHVKLNCSDGYESAVEKQFLGLKYMYEQKNTPWYFFAGCDTYVNSKYLKEWLQGCNSNIPVYLGSRTHIGDVSKDYKGSDRFKYFLSGGPGIILSRALMDIIYPRLHEFSDTWKEDLKLFQNVHPAASDVALAYVLWKLYKVHCTAITDSQYEMYHCPPKDYTQIVNKPISFHYITPDLMIQLYGNK